MATAGDIVARALRLATIVPIGRTPSAKDASDALDALNDMLASWKERGIDLGLENLASGDAVTQHVRAIRLNLAAEIAPPYGVQPANIAMGASTLANEADAELRRLKAKYRQRREVSADAGVLCLSRQTFDGRLR